MAGTDGTIRGVITDENNTPLPGATIQIPELGIGTMADADGSYYLLNVEVGTYTVQAAMIGYSTQKVNGVRVLMDQAYWLNFTMKVEAVKGQEIIVSGERALVEKGATSKKVTMSSETIEALPIKDMADLMNLQSGVVKVEGGQQGAIPDHEERGLQEIHVRGGRSGEIAYMIDGLYIRNPIFGGIGNGTRLNLFAIKEYDWQPGGFNSEYGDAMSAVANYHTNRGGRKFKYKFNYSTSLVGAMLGSEYDDLRGYNDYSLGLGGPFPFTNKMVSYWISGQHTTNDNYRVMEFDSTVYIENDPGNNINRNNMVQPWDTQAGFRGFGFDNTTDVFGNMTIKLSNKFKINLSSWQVWAHRKGFNPSYLYWDEGQNELFRETERYTIEINHSVTQSTFYTLRASQFIQDQFQGVRWKDSDGDGYPDWYEWSNPAGTRQNPDQLQISDPYNPDVVPYFYSDDGESVYYINKDGNGPGQWTSGWYYGAPVPGNYNWDVAEDFNDNNLDGIFDPEVDTFDLLEHDLNNNGIWDGPELVQESQFRDGSYWLTPEMYVDYQDFQDDAVYWNNVVQHPGSEWYGTGSYSDLDSLYFLPNYLGVWSEGSTFGGSDRFYSTSRAETQEIRFDLTSQLNQKWKARIGVDYKTHKLNFYEVQNPWDDAGAFRQRFAEQWDDFGIDGTYFLDDTTLINGLGVPDPGEGNGVWDQGESFYDFNDNNQWDDYVQPEEISLYLQNTFEVPWMVINAGFRADGVNYNTKIWADPDGEFSAEIPWFWSDCGLDGLCADSDFYVGKDLGEDDGVYQSYGNGVYNYGEIYSDQLNGVYDEGDNFTDFSGDGYFDPGVDVFDPETDDIVGNGVYDYDENFDDMNGNSVYDPGIDIFLPEYDLNNNGVVDGEPFEDEGEQVSKQFGMTNARVFFRDSEWFWKFSPRLGISHVITDEATFTFNYGVYHQTPVYENIYLNTNRQEDPEELFEESEGYIGNATMTAARAQSYEFGFNFQIGSQWGLSVMGWLKDMDQMTTYKTYRSGIYEYLVSSNGDYGTAKGIDLTLHL